MDFSICKTPHKYHQPVLSPSNKQGDFNALGVDSPNPFRVNGKLYMNYTGFDGEGYQSALASSEDGYHWTHEKVIIKKGPKGSLTQYNCALTHILRDNQLYGSGELKKVNGKYLGTFHAYPEPGYEAGSAVIGLAWSENLLDWEMDNGILFPVDDWEKGGMYKSTLFEENGRYYIFYNAKENLHGPWHEQIGMAWSDDLKVWHKHPDNPLLKNGEKGSYDDTFAADPQILKYNDTYYMFYYGFSSDQKKDATDLVAASKNLFDWTKCEYPLVEKGTGAAIDSRYAHKPGVILGNNGELLHFYCAVSPSDEYSTGEYRVITLASSKPL